jgi:hypothetical protein
MRKLSYFGLIVTIGFCIASARAGEIALSGPISGIWPAGTTVHITGPSYIPTGKSLSIEEGVKIYFDTPDRFIVEGGLTVVGTSQSPVTVFAPANWWGITFKSNGYEIRTLHYVVMDEQSGLPWQIITAEDALLNIEHCKFNARLSCLRMSGGRLWASNNYFATSQLYSCPVWLSHLNNDIDGPCDNPVGNRLSETIIDVTVSHDEIPRPTDEFTSGLWLEGTTNICLYGDAITADAPGTVVGAYFGGRATYNGTLWTLPFCVVTVTSFRGSAKGVFNANEGSLRMLRCTVDVAREPSNSPLVPSGIIASHEADVWVNSCYVQLDVGGYYFVGLSGGQLTVDHLVAWRSSEIGGGLPGHLPDGSTLGDVWVGGHVAYTDPQFNLHGDRGHWTSLQDVYDYYSLRSTSPCIDAGDPDIGNDPDNTLPDVGRFFYDQGEDAADRPSLVPNSTTLAMPYPNPFNATAVVPFELGRTATVKLTVYNSLGRDVRTLVAGRFGIGKHTVLFNGENLASGVYFVMLRADGVPVGTRTITLLK